MRVCALSLCRSGLQDAHRWATHVHQQLISLQTFVDSELHKDINRVSSSQQAQTVLFRKMHSGLRLGLSACLESVEPFLKLCVLQSRCAPPHNPSTSCGQCALARNPDEALLDPDTDLNQRANEAQTDEGKSAKDEKEQQHHTPAVGEQMVSRNSRECVCFV